MRRDDLFSRTEDDASAYDGMLAGYVVMKSYYPTERETGAPARAQGAVSAATRPRSRYCDRPMDWRTRLFGISGTAGAFGLIVGCALFTWNTVYPAQPVAEPLVVTLKPLAAPPEPVEEVPEGPRQVEQKEQKPKEQERPQPPEIIIPHLTPVTLPAAPPVDAVRAADPVPETTAPKSMPAPPARQAVSNEKATWEAKLLAHLEKYRRYPAAAGARREEGVAYVTFRMNRAGAVLSAEIVRSSGSVMLDSAALDTLKRAQPLPAIPDDKPDHLELSVPVEFFVRR